MAALAAVLGLVTVLYFPTLNDPFHGDDFVAFTEFKTNGFFEYSRDVFLFKDTNFYWRPLGCILHYSLFAIFGLNPFVFRLAALLIFLATIAGIYRFCLGEGLGRLPSTLSALMFGILPGDVVSVSWVTNTSRLTAGLFVVLCLLLLQKTRARRHLLLLESAAFLCFAVAVLSDEVTAAMAPLPLVYWWLLVREGFDLRTAVLRLFPYAALVAVVVPLQFTYTIHDEGRLMQYGLGPHIWTSAWVITSQLALPLASGGPLDVFLQRFSWAEWTAGAAVISYCGLLVVMGSKLSRFLVIWTLLSLVPFALWEPINISPRYVYLTAMPFSILGAWSLVQLVSAALALVAKAPFGGSFLRAAMVPFALVALSILTVVSAKAVQDRNAAWSQETAKYGVLRKGLEDQPKPAPGSRLIIMYGEWPDFWATAVARTVYGDPSLSAISIPRQRVAQPFNPQPDDLVFYLQGGHLLPTTLRR